MQDKRQQLESDTEPWTSSKLGNEYIKAVYCHPACLTNMQSTSWEMSGWKTHKLESRFPGEISTTSGYEDDITFMAESEEDLKSLLMKVNGRVKKLA